jgi:hypothetical protein
MDTLTPLPCWVGGVYWPRARCATALEAPLADGSISFRAARGGVSQALASRRRRGDSQPASLIGAAQEVGSCAPTREAADR